MQIIFSYFSFCEKNNNIRVKYGIMYKVSAEGFLPHYHKPL